MHKLIYRAARIVLPIVISGLFFQLAGADGKPDKKKSQAAYQLGERADQDGRRNAAIAAYTEAIEADGGNAAALRARGKDYSAAGNQDKAGADFDAAVKVQPGDPQCYFARGQFFSDTAQPDRAAQDFTTAISLKLERTEVYNARGNAYRSE